MKKLIGPEGSRNSSPLSSSRERETKRNRFLAGSVFIAGLITAATGAFLSNRPKNSWRHLPEKTTSVLCEGIKNPKTLDKTVKKGDPLIKTEFLFEKAGHFSFMEITDVDDGGIVLDSTVKVSFGKIKRFDDRGFPLSILAQKGARPGTADVLICIPDGTVNTLR